jgi:hypothetical protein
MPYEKTIGGQDYTFSGTLSTTPKTMFELLSTNDKAELTEALLTRVSVDGWITGAADFTTQHKIGGATETVTSGTRFPMPVYQWHNKRLFSGSEGQVVTIRIILSE